MRVAFSYCFADDVSKNRSSVCDEMVRRGLVGVIGGRMFIVPESEEVGKRTMRIV